MAKKKNTKKKTTKEKSKPEATAKTPGKIGNLVRRK